MLHFRINVSDHKVFEIMSHKYRKSVQAETCPEGTCPTATCSKWMHRGNMALARRRRNEGRMREMRTT